MSALAETIIKKFEGCKLTAYLDQGNVPTIGYGATGPDIHIGLSWTQAQADARLESDLSHVEAALTPLVHVTLTEGQRAALLSFAFNLGIHALTTSNLLHLVNSSDTNGAAKEFLRWDHIGTQEIRGLLIRRLHEATLFLEGQP